jgi:phosphoserine aminotransferase
MSDRSFNFSAGPAALPTSVLEQAQRDLVVLPGVGASPLEVSHRGAWFKDVIAEAEANLRWLLVIPDSHHVVFCQGGATQQFAMVAMNLSARSATPPDYVVTGSWGARAAAEAVRLGDARIAWTDEDEGFVRVPDPGALAEAAALRAPYLHITTNETIHGVEFPTDPTSGNGVPLVADMSSDLLSRPVAVERYGVIYAGAQKNAGPAGVTIAIVRHDLLEDIPDGLPSMLDYRTFVEHGSMFNTPPVFAIYVVLLVTRWLRDEVGGLAAQEGINREKAASLYTVIDASDGFYRGHAQPGSRSLMNVTWRLPTEDLDERFVAEAAAEDLRELKGHRSIGGIRASLYNAMPRAGVDALASFMRGFLDRNG